LKIVVAKNIGFCFGVERAIRTVEELLDEGKKVVTDGEIVHKAGAFLPADTFQEHTVHLLGEHPVAGDSF